MNNLTSLTRKLHFGADLRQADIDRLERISQQSRAFSATQDLIVENDRPDHVHVVFSGTACRYKHLPDGRRAIVALLLPGDFCDLRIYILGRMDHSIGALTDCVVSRVPAQEMEEILRDYPTIERACVWASLVDEAVLREWLVNVGRRSSEKQLAHLFCELYVRLDTVGLTYGHQFPMPYTQVVLGDLLGISQVHVQRVLSNLREDGLVSLQDRRIQITDFEALATLGEFDSNYLHLGRPWQ